MSYGQGLTKKILAYWLGPPSHENYRPDWLMGCEIDLYWEHHAIAVEFQGDQHYIPVFDGHCLGVQEVNDSFKAKVIKGRGISFQRIDAIDLQHGVINRIIKKWRRERGIRRKSVRLSDRDKVEIRALFKTANEYRDHMRKAYSSPSCMRRKGQKRRRVVEQAKCKNHPGHKQYIVRVEM